jgi:hypothetical protein
MCEKQTAGYRYGCYGDAWMWPQWRCVTWAMWAAAHENNKTVILQKEVALLTVPGETATLSFSPSLTLQTSDGNGKKSMDRHPQRWTIERPKSKTNFQKAHNLTQGCILLGLPFLL